MSESRPMAPRWLACFALLLAVSSASGSPPRNRLTFAARVEAQRALEQLYQSWLTGGPRPSTERVTQDLSNEKVSRYLRQSAALEELWNMPITGEALEHELDRILSSTRQPERLREIFGALGNDSVLIQETFVRAALVDRLSRRFFAYDDRIHEPARRQAERENLRLRKGSLPSDDSHSVTETRDAFVTRVRDAVLTTPKETWDSWWRRSESRFPSLDVPVVAQTRPLTHRGNRPSPASPLSCLPDDTWVPIGGPELRSGHAALWTGREMIIWGGDYEEPLDTGARYDPLIDAWAPISSVNAPQARYAHAAVWTGSKMIVWGGEGHPSPVRTFLNSGGIYDSQTDTWTSMSMVGAPIGRWYPTAVWTGERMIVWGGHAFLRDLNDGALYDPQTDSWTPMMNLEAPSPRDGHTAVWTGERMIVFGDAPDAGLYDPTTDSWTPMSTEGSPGARVGHTAVWTGSEMIVWGGRFGINTGARYAPDADRWEPMTTQNAPSGRGGHLAVWTGSEMIVWGGTSDASGGRYDPRRDSWTPTATYGAPTGSGYRAVWSGTQMIVWGGAPFTEGRAGGRYNPDSDTWMPMINDSRQARELHDAVWTGREMIIYGGQQSPFDPPLSTGDRYDPATDTFTPIATAGAPTPRSNAAVVWTGREMIVWGGYDGTRYVNTGSRYDPVSDTWRSTNTLNAPFGPERSPVWTGTEMLLCCGLSIDESGGDRYIVAAYDPAGDEWRVALPIGPTDRRFNHFSVWTGSEMIVWGGLTTEFTNTGFLYNPMTDQTRSMSTLRAPEGRSLPAGVWTGTEMIVWGGYRGHPGPREFDDGGRFDPVTNTWQPISMTNAPAERAGHTAIWTGSEMIVWGGYEGPAGVSRNTGGRYDPARDAWTPTSMAGAPIRRHFHTAVWTGDSMLMFGGWRWHSGGGAYGAGGPADLDEDGLSGCEGDCDDTDPLIHPGTFEIPGNATDEDCDGSTRCDPRGSDSRQEHVRCVTMSCHDLERRGLVTREWCRALISNAGSGAWCGDNVTETPEICDGREVGGESCQTLGYDLGDLACSPQCDGIDLTDCAAICGDGIRRGDEACDGADLNGRTCASVGYQGGDLACDPSCTRFDVSDCTICGDGELEGDEVCEYDWYDGGIYPEDVTCRDLGFDGGTIGCEPTCDAFDTTYCTDCGNGDREAGEQCDGGDLAGQSCTSIGLDGGTLACNPTCGLDVSGCADCGNGRRETGEVCDRADIAGATCEGLGLEPGFLACEENCAAFDLSGCGSLCGDGVVSGAEICDGAVLDGMTCGSLGFTGGALACDASCASFDTDGCTSCGDGRREGNEGCDGADHGGRTCASFGFNGGTLVCRPDCSFNISGCSICGNNAREGGEACDGTDVGGETCQGLGHLSGTLRCNNSCTAFDTSNCSTCGNGIREGSEHCDSFDLGGATCEGKGFGGGVLRCTSLCAYDVTGCFLP